MKTTAMDSPNEVPIDTLTATLISDGSPKRSLSRERFGAAYAQGLRRTIAFLISRGTGVDVAEELAQYAWARGWECRTQLRCEDNLQPWINNIAYHRLCNEQRQRRWYKTETDEPAVRTFNPTDSIDAARMLKRCSSFEKLLMMQHYWEGMRIREIAKLHGLSEIAVRLRIHRCRRTLRSYCLKHAA